MTLLIESIKPASWPNDSGALSMSPAARAVATCLPISAAFWLVPAILRADPDHGGNVGQVSILIEGLSFQTGDDYVGRPPEWGRQQRDEYNRLRYHQPDDELLPWYTVDGALQQARVVARVALLVGDATEQPTWNPASEFRAAGSRRLGL